MRLFVSAGPKLRALTLVNSLDSILCLKPRICLLLWLLYWSCFFPWADSGTAEYMRMLHRCWTASGDPIESYYETSGGLRALLAPSKSTAVLVSSNWRKFSMRLLLLAKFAQRLLFIHVFLVCITCLLPSRASPLLVQTLFLFQLKSQENPYSWFVFDFPHTNAYSISGGWWRTGSEVLSTSIFTGSFFKFPVLQSSWLCPSSTWQH